MGIFKLKPEYLPHYSIHDYESWVGKWELINGIPYSLTEPENICNAHFVMEMSPSPNSIHQEISGNIHIELKTKLLNCNNCKAKIALDWRISHDTVVCPDNYIVCNAEDDNFTYKTPVLIFEILSPSTALHDRTIKKDLYCQNGVKYYVIVDANSKQCEVFELEENTYIQKSTVKNDTINFDLGECNIDFDFKKIWE